MLLAVEPVVCPCLVPGVPEVKMASEEEQEPVSGEERDEVGALAVQPSAEKKYPAAL